ncbi:C-GCAxxG-C-C family protein [Fusibacter ferrireducens]|uniref:C_GCAxxG_C_C family protein n=1 Tax=Fusibacter ferrireducens TaxID=2785058 RepID=A0ABR9ZQK2_9FIRM|nr:C-GCAxxG-C-C family (seleno)protein [Fusibacter ferrireducens]MBF4692709.1 C_GCAxxG_C_C family protein [Fusibacter ferrireducens]
MLKDLIEQGFGNSEGYNCAEKILYGANEVYGLGLPHQVLKIASGFGGGMMTENACGAVTASVMVIGLKVTETVAHESEALKPVVQAFIAGYEKEMKSIICAPLKVNYRTEEEGCVHVIVKAAEVLDRTMQTYKLL